MGEHAVSKLSLNEENFARIISFMDDINVADEHFRKEVLLAFEDLFGIERMNFWLCDDQQRLIDPVTNNIRKEITKDYLDNYIDEDPVVPNKLIDVLPKRRVIELASLPQTKIKNNAYVYEFMRKYNLYNNTALFLMKNDRVLGLVDYSSRHDRRLSRSEKMSLEIIARYLAERFHEHLALHKTENMIASITLTPREKEVLHFIQKGLSNQQIADALFISINTVKKHVKRLYEKFEVKNRTSLVYKLYQLEGDTMKIS